MSQYDIKDIKGVIPALLSFFDQDEKPDEKATRTIVRALIETGINGLYLTGSTGECFTMSPAERMEQVEIIIDEVKGRVPIIVHVGDIGTRKSIALARHAEDAGADAISSVPPFYWHFDTDNIVKYYREIAESCHLPMIVYNIDLAGIMTSDLLLEIAKIENVKGLKYTARSHDQMGLIKRLLGKDFMIYSGCDEMAFSGFAFGADGIIGSFYNVIPELYVAIYEGFQKGEIQEAMKLQHVADDLIFAALKYDFPPILRNFLAWRGLPKTYSRSPFINYTDEEAKGLKDELCRIKRDHQTNALDCFHLD